MSICACYEAGLFGDLHLMRWHFSKVRALYIGVSIISPLRKVKTSARSEQSQPAIPNAISAEASKSSLPRRRRPLVYHLGSCLE